MSGSVSASTKSTSCCANAHRIMPGNKGDYDNLLQGIDSGAVTLEQVKINASRVVRTVRALTQELNTKTSARLDVCLAKVF